MAAPVPSAPALALALLPVLALLPADVSSTTNHCAKLQQESMEDWKTIGEYVVPQPQNVTVVWGTRVAHAAAALLRASLLAAGFSNVSTHYESASAHLCDLLSLEYRPDDSDTRAVVVVPVTQALGSDGPRCSWSGGRGWLRVAGEGAAPVDVRLHARLAVAIANTSVCRGASSVQFYEDLDKLRTCGFLPLASASVGTIEPKNAILYVLRGERESMGNELEVRLFESGSDGRLNLDRQFLNRSELALLMAEAAHSFLFLDAELWADTPHVHVIEPSPATCAPRPRSLRVAGEYALLVNTPTLYELFKNLSVPRPADLRTILERADSHLFGGDVEEAVCELARGYANASAPEVFAEWRDKAMQPVAHKALVMFCREDEDYDEYKKLCGLVGNYVYNFTKTIKLGIEIELANIDCQQQNGTVSQILKMVLQYNFDWPSRVVSLVLPSEAALAVKSYGKDLMMPLLTYEVGDDTTSTTGRLTHLALALRHLLGGCDSRVLAILSEPSWITLEPLGVAGELSACHQRNMSMEFIPDITRALQELNTAGARVFVVNARAGAAARVLASALALNYTRAAGYVWVVLEYDAADDATRELEPYSVSFQWRGDTPLEGKASEAGLRAELEGLWPERAWPRHAASVADALLTLGEGFKRLVEKYPDMRDNPYTEDKLRYFWNGIRNKEISGIIQHIRYNASGIWNQIVYVDQWSNKSRPRRVLAWRVGELWTQEDICPEMHKVTSRCYVPAGDECHPRCDTNFWVLNSVLALLSVVTIALSIRVVKRAFEYHIASVRTKTMKRLLAGRERTFAILAPYMVDRMALDRREEIGEGHYGRVWYCFLNKPRGTQQQVTVAAKELLDDATPEEETRFLREACTLATLDHEHVVRFVGVCLLDGPPLLLLMEYALFGDLRRYLRARRHLAVGTACELSEELVGREEAAYVSAEALTQFAREAAEALAFLAQRGLVHRDVRAANCLVNERRSLKLADFGLARALDEPDGEYAMGGPRMVPVRYWPPESLTFGVSGTASDVWSLGVLVLELVTLGERPYGTLPLASVVDRVRGGGHPPLPRDASVDTQRVVMLCWRTDAVRRPAAAWLAAWLTKRPRALHPAVDYARPDSGFEELISSELSDCE